MATAKQRTSKGPGRIQERRQKQQKPSGIQKLKGFFSKKKKKKVKDWVGGQFFLFFLFSIFSCCTKRGDQSQEDLAKYD